MGLSKEDIEAMQKRVSEKRSSNKLLDIIPDLERMAFNTERMSGQERVVGTTQVIVNDLRKHLPIIRLNVPPMSAPRQSRRDSWSPSPRVKRYREWKDLFRKECEVYGWELGDTLDITFFIPMPKSWSKKKRLQMNSTPHKQKPDIDNLCKAVMDAHGKDDGHVWKLRASKIWNAEGAISIKR